ncbi:polyubiquitin 11-like [Branchiostoma floridae]|uniref:Polyubiquitin 11-like n=1 Tax=Branchiostoma floridae TaxID=7739 RepID=A0A9J7HQ29_BRAFL|nr:polyubiquitin 11-like [Branchiostoma floridae]
MAKRKRAGDADEDVVTMSTLRELLDNQKKELTGLMEVQERNFRSFMETVMVTTNRRLDDLIREVQDVKGSLQYSQGEIGGAGTRCREEQEQRIAKIESQFAKLRAESNILHLYVKGITGKTTVLRIHKDATVDKLFRKISKGNRIPPEDLRILYTTKQLEYGGDKYLSDYDVKDGSTLFVCLRLRGG